MNGSPPIKLIPSSRNHGALLMVSSLLICVLFGGHMIDILRQGGAVDGMFVALYALCTLGTLAVGYQFYSGLFFVREDVLTLMESKVAESGRDPSAATA